jgi:hypothetical protein
MALYLVDPTFAKGHMMRQLYQSRVSIFAMRTIRWKRRRLALTREDSKFAETKYLICREHLAQCGETAVDAKDCVGGGRLA